MTADCTKEKIERKRQNKVFCLIRKSFTRKIQWAFHTIIIPSAVLCCLVCIFVGTHSANAASKLAKIRCTKDQHGNNNCTCPEDPITARYVDHESDQCQFYYLCHLGVAIKMTCNPFWAFHPKLAECLPRDRIPKNVCRPLVDCPVIPNRYIEDPEDCTKFYLCYYGKHFHWTCPEYSYFDPDKEKCLNDRGQAEACILQAKRNFYKKLGHAEKPPPKTSIALTQARTFMKTNMKPKVQKRQKG